MLPLTYVLPLRCRQTEHGSHDDLAAYLRELAAGVDEVIVVDGSPAALAGDHRAAFGDQIRLIPPGDTTLNGKVGGVTTGVREARNEAVVIADDDVRYRFDQLAAVSERLERADVVRPQNYFSPVPWHALFDTARTLLNRAIDGDWPGTLAVRRSTFLRAGGYRGDVLFENLELVRTIEAVGGIEELARDVLVARRPPTTRHFFGQQVRQAYDEFARPARLVVSLAVLPAAITMSRSGRRRQLIAAGAALVMMAELGRRREGGRGVYPATASGLAPVYALWRSGCSWAALVARGRGGAKYRDVRIVCAATSKRALRSARAGNLRSRGKGCPGSFSGKTRRSDLPVSRRLLPVFRRPAARGRLI